MALPIHSQNPSVRNHQLKHESLKVGFTIVGHATPGSKTHTVDLPGIMILRTEGITTAADALETITFTTAVDATNACFGILIDGSELGSIRKVKGAKLTQVLATGTAIVTRAPNSGVPTAMLTAGGNIAIEFLMTGTDLGSGAETAVCLLEIEYELN